MTAIVNKVARYIGKAVSGGGGSGGGSGGGFDVFSALSTGLNLASASSAFFGAREQAGAQIADANAIAYARELEAKESDLEAERISLRGKQEMNLIMDDVLQTVAANQVSFSAFVDPSFGTPVAVADQTRDLGARKIDRVRSDTLMNQIAARRQAGALRLDADTIRLKGQNTARNTKQAGLVSAGGRVAELIGRRISRG